MKWLDEVADKDYQAAYDFLSIRLSPDQARWIVARFRDEMIQHRSASDILRSTDLHALPRKDLEVKHIIKDNERESPILFVSYPYSGDIADGYHRTSAAYQEDPEQMVPLKIVQLDKHP